MKHLNESIKLNENFPELDCLELPHILDGSYDYADYDIDEETFEYLKKHCKCMTALGGYDGNGEDAYTALAGEGIKLSKIDRDFEDKDVYDVLPEGEIDDPKILKEFGRVLKINAKCGSILYCAGYESPFVLLFDEKNNKTKEIVDNIIPFS